MTDTALVTATLAEPVAAVRDLRNDYRQESYDHIPGTVVRGALAATWIRHHRPPKQDDVTFLEIFESDGTFGPLHSHNSLPVPLSVKVHKYRPGATCTQLWWDTATGSKDDFCPSCKQKLEFSKGDPTGQVQRSQRTHVALDEEGVAVDGSLYRQNSIAAGNVFAGWLSGPAVRALTIDGALVDTLIFGGKQSVQGRAEIAVDFAAEPEPVKVDGDTVILYLAAPGVFVDAFGLPSDEPDLCELSGVLGVKALEVTRKRVRWTSVGGWHQASGLPKSTERAVQAGSVYQIRCAEAPAEDARRALMARGVGLRRREGFGALYLPQEPFTRHRWKGLLAPMRGDWKTFQAQLPLLRARVAALRNGIRDDAPYQERLEVGDRYATALRELLSITDPGLVSDLLDDLEAGK
ncbi:type III-B CRISPR module-associated Cmr3 family protein [Saccharopolyspora sp. 5N708]|uniref:type III-B CRISPR module-associated Cmr3 family protein n=1 Tax=Saccharopolyspora sp. 5N708 TaxID=3457424 RepID=UPI003FD382F5